MKSRLIQTLTWANLESFAEVSEPLTPRQLKVLLKALATYTICVTLSTAIAVGAFPVGMCTTCFEFGGFSYRKDRVF